MTCSHEKTPAPVAAGNEGAGNAENTSTPILAHLMDTKKSTRGEAVFLDGTTAPQANTFAPRLLVSELHDHGLDALIRLCPACIEENDRRVLEKQREEEEKQTRIREREQRERERSELVQKLTNGECLHELDLPGDLVAAYRAGRDYRVFLDAMKALDDMDLADAGLTSWGEGGRR